MSDRPDIEGLRALVEAMTPGEWRADDDVVVVGPDDADPREAVVSFYHPPFGTPHAYNNAIGCAALRNAAPALLDHIARLEAALASVAVSLDVAALAAPSLATLNAGDTVVIDGVEHRVTRSLADIKAGLAALLPGTKETAP